MIPRDYDQLWRGSWQQVQAVGPMTHSRYRLILAELEPLLRPGARLLDVGCGNGALLARLLERHPGLDVHGLEGSPAAVASAPPGLAERIRVGDLYAELPRLAAAPFDAIVASEVLEHLEEPDRALRLMAAALVPGGVAVFTVPAGRRWWSVQDEYAGHVQRFEADEFRALLQANGFAVERLRCWGTTVALAYDRLVSRVGPQRVTGMGEVRGSRWVAKALVQAFKVEDLLDSPRGIQLVATVRKS